MTERYDVNSHPHGLVLIINNENYSSNNASSRRRDARRRVEENIQKVFQSLEFEVVCHRDCKGTQTMDYISDSRMMIQKRALDSLFVFVIAQGEQDCIRSVDGEVLDIWNDIVREFCGLRCKQLKDKPKVFIFQSCHGDISLSDEQHQEASKLKDCLVVIPAPSENGSPMIQQLCQSLKNHHEDVHLHNILNLSIEKLRSVGEEEIFQPVVHSTFTKDFYLPSPTDDATSTSSDGLLQLQRAVGEPAATKTKTVEEKPKQTVSNMPTEATEPPELPQRSSLFEPINFMSICTLNSEASNTEFYADNFIDPYMVTDGKACKSIGTRKDTFTKVTYVENGRPVETSENFSHVAEYTWPIDTENVMDFKIGEEKKSGIIMSGTDNLTQWQANLFPKGNDGKYRSCVSLGLHCLKLNSEESPYVYVRWLCTVSNGEGIVLNTVENIMVLGEDQITRIPYLLKSYQKLPKILMLNFQVRWKKLQNYLQSPLGTLDSCGWEDSDYQSASAASASTVASIRCEWTITGWVTASRGNGSAVKSSTFGRGDVIWSLEFYPHGRLQDDSEVVALGVRMLHRPPAQRAGMQVRACLKIKGVDTIGKLDKHFIFKKGLALSYEVGRRENLLQHSKLQIKAKLEYNL